MLCQITDPTKMIKTLASLIGKDQSALVFVPTRRAGRALERELAAGGAVLLPKIVPLGEGADDDAQATDNLERAVVLARLLSGIEGGFSANLPVAQSLISLYDHLENEGVDPAAVDWTTVVRDEKKAAFLDAVKGLDLGAPSAVVVRNNGIAAWKDKLKDYSHVFVCGSTASVAASADLMKTVAAAGNGHVIFPALLNNFDEIGRTDPYWSIKRFGGKIETVDCGKSRIGFFNKCFANDLSGEKMDLPPGIKRIDAATESDEARAVADIAARAKGRGESVLIITPDAAGGQRIAEALAAYDLSVDSSAGTPVSKTRAGRIAGMICDLVLGTEKPEVIEKDLDLAMPADYSCDILSPSSSPRRRGPTAPQELFIACGAVGPRLRGDDERKEAVPRRQDDPCRNLWSVIAEQVDRAPAEFWAGFEKARELSERHGLDAQGAAAVLNDAMGRESVRPPIGESDVVILGTAEARMQSADVVILTGLNEGIFPAEGFSHPWVPRTAAERIGLPSPDAKVSLQALDFMTLSCAPKVFWTRSKMSGGAATTPSRFLSRVAAKVRDMPVEIATVQNPPPAPPTDTAPPVFQYSGVYWATWLEDLIHNPYQFYAKHILHLRKLSDIGDDVGAREFGTMVHQVLENCAGACEPEIIKMLEAAAEKIVPRTSVLFRFWQNRFREMAPAIAALPAGAELEKEISGEIFGRRIRAKADRIEEARVVDYKTGAVPTRAQLGLGKDADCTMPQLPVEAILTGASEMAFLRLQRKHVGMVEFDGAETAAAAEAAKNKLGFLFAQDTYARPDHFLDEKYRDFDDMARAE